MTDPSSSGNRWEPRPTDGSTDPSDQTRPITPQPAAPTSPDATGPLPPVGGEPGPVPATHDVGDVPDAARRTTARRAGLVALAAALFLGGGAGGYAIGAATSSPTDGTPTRSGVPGQDGGPGTGGLPGDRDGGRHHDFDGPGTPGQEAPTQPDGSSAPGDDT